MTHKTSNKKPVLPIGEEKQQEKSELKAIIVGKDYSSSNPKKNTIFEINASSVWFCQLLLNVIASEPNPDKSPTRISINQEELSEILKIGKLLKPNQIFMLSRPVNEKYAKIKCSKAWNYVANLSLRVQLILLNASNYLGATICMEILASFVAERITKKFKISRKDKDIVQDLIDSIYDLNDVQSVPDVITFIAKFMRGQGFPQQITMTKTVQQVDYSEANVARTYHYDLCRGIADCYILPKVNKYDGKFQSFSNFQYDNLMTMVSLYTKSFDCTFVVGGANKILLVLEKATQQVFYSVTNTESRKVLAYKEYLYGKISSSNRDWNIIDGAIGRIRCKYNKIDGIFLVSNNGKTMSSRNVGHGGYTKLSLWVRIDGKTRIQCIEMQ